MTIIETEQSRETPLAEIARGPFTFRFASYRKSEDAKLDLRSEDFIISELTPGRAIFSLCDGVGSSFYGNIGSQILGEILTNWMRGVSLPNSSILGRKESLTKWTETLTGHLLTELNGRTGLATNIIQKKDLTSKDELIRLAETTQRDDFGTQSNFACGILWSRSTSLPDGLILLFWLGNARIRIFNENRELTHLLGWGNDPDQLKEVWSSKDGVVGRVYSHVTDLSKLTTVMAYSDGLENVEELIHPGLDGTELEMLVTRSQSIKDDDVTYLELSTIQGEVAGLSDEVVGFLRASDQPQAVRPQPVLPDSKQALNTLQKKYEDQISSARKINGTLIALVALFSITCLLAGLVMGVVLGPGIFPTPTETPTITPSITPVPSQTPFPTETPTEILTPTETVPPSFTLLPTDSGTPTVPFTPTSTETSTPTFTNTLNPQ